MTWFSNPDFWKTFYEWAFPAESFDQAKKQVEDIVKLTGISSGTVLDLCCGPGRHSIPLSKAGFEVTGVDLQPFLLEKAKAYATKEKATIEFIKEDMRKFRHPESFDLVLNMFSSFGYFEYPAEDLKVAENVYDSLKPGGQFLLDLKGKEIAAKELVETMSTEMPNGDLVFQRIHINHDWTRAKTTWVYVSGNRADTYEVRLTLYSGMEMRNLLKQAGFVNVKLYGDLKGSPYDHNAKRLIVVAEKR